MNTNIIENYYFKQSVVITLKSRDEEKMGIITDPIRDDNGEVTHWRFIPNKNVGKFTERYDESLVQYIPHNDIKFIDYIIKN